MRRSDHLRHHRRGGGRYDGSRTVSDREARRPELELPSRVSAEVHDDEAVTTPSLLGIGTVSADVLPANDVVPWITKGAPLTGLNTITHAGVFSPRFRSRTR